MYKLILSIVLLGLSTGIARSAFILGTSDAPGTPLVMTAGTSSGPMLVNVVSDNPPNDIMAAWQFQLEILPISAVGGLTYQDPATGTADNPPDYIFGQNGLGISVTNSGTELSANDFFDPSVGSGVAGPGTPGANLLQMNFQASGSASGLFGVYAAEGLANTVWTDSGFTTQMFSNVPDGTGAVLIGEVLVNPSPVPEPASFSLLVTGIVTLIGLRTRRKLG